MVQNQAQKDDTINMPSSSQQPSQAQQPSQGGSKPETKQPEKTSGTDSDSANKTAGNAANATTKP